MSKDPAFLFYPNDYLGGTMGMTFEQKGAYIDLLIFQFNNHQFTEAQAKQVLSICFASVWEVLKNKFKKDGEFYFNERLRSEIDKRKAFAESRRINALHPKKARKAYAKHMGNENENRNIDINKNKKETYSEEFESFWAVYPNKSGSKKSAFNEWKKLNGTRPAIETILEAIRKQIEWRDNANGEFRPEWKHAERWIKNNMWESELTTGKKEDVPWYEKTSIIS